MKRLLSSSLLFLLLCACSPRITLNIEKELPINYDDGTVYVLDENTKAPPDAEYIGTISVQSSFSNAVIELAAINEAFRAGGNVLDIQSLHHVKFFSAGDKASLEGRILSVNNPEYLTNAVVRRENLSIYPLKKKPFELSFSISGEPGYAFEVAPFGFEYFSMGPFSATDLYDYSYYARTSGVFSLEAAWQFNECLALTGSVGYSSFKFSHVDPSTDRMTRTEMGSVFTVFAGLRFYWLSRPVWKTYSAFQGGYYHPMGETSYWQKTAKPDRQFGGQLTLFGLHIGRKSFLVLELYGFGDYYNTILPGAGGKIGYGYRF